MKNILYSLLLISTLAACNQKSESTSVEKKSGGQANSNNNLNQTPTLEELKAAAKLEINNPNQQPKDACSKHSICPIFPSSKIAIDRIRDVSKIHKDTFEKTEDYSKRTCDKVLEVLKSVQTDKIDFEVFDHLPAIYNADKGMFEIKLDNMALGLQTKEGKGFSAITLAREINDSGNYSASNAFGVTKNIKSSNWQELVMLVKKNSGDKIFSLKTNLTVPIEDAKKLQNDLQLIVTAQIQTPCLISEQDRLSPTITNPTDTSFSKYILVAEKNAQWRLLKRSTGEILKSGTF